MPRSNRRSGCSDLVMLSERMAQMEVSMAGLAQYVAQWSQVDTSATTGNSSSGDVETLGAGDEHLGGSDHWYLTTMQCPRTERQHPRAVKACPSPLLAQARVFAFLVAVVHVLCR